MQIKRKTDRDVQVEDGLGRYVGVVTRFEHGAAWQGASYTHSLGCCRYRKQDDAIHQLMASYRSLPSEMVRRIYGEARDNR